MVLAFIALFLASCGSSKNTTESNTHDTGTIKSDSSKQMKKTEADSTASENNNGTFKKWSFFGCPPVTPAISNSDSGKTAVKIPCPANQPVATYEERTFNKDKKTATSKKTYEAFNTYQHYNVYDHFNVTKTTEKHTSFSFWPYIIVAVISFILGILACIYGGKLFAPAKIIGEAEAAWNAAKFKALGKK